MTLKDAKEKFDEIDEKLCKIEDYLNEASTGVDFYNAYQNIQNATDDSLKKEATLSLYISGFGLIDDKISFAYGGDVFTIGDFILGKIDEDVAGKVISYYKTVDIYAKVAFDGLDLDEAEDLLEFANNYDNYRKAIKAAQEINQIDQVFYDIGLFNEETGQIDITVYNNWEEKVKNYFSEPDIWDKISDWVYNAWNNILESFNKSKDNDFVMEDIDKEEFYSHFTGDEERVNTGRDILTKLGVIKSEFNRAEEIERRAPYVAIDPLIIDLDRDGFNIEKLENGTHFDLDNNSFAEKVNWTRKDGFLALDLNGNGVIDNGGELFGDRTLLADGSYASGGFAALSQYDLNNDGVIDANDEIFSRLKVWTDRNGDGVSTEDEIMTLEEAGISSIDLNSTDVNAETGTEAVLGRKGSVHYTDGTTGEAAELWAAALLYDTVDRLDVDVTSENDVKGIGNVRDLNKAMALDATGKLSEYVNEFKNASNRDEMFAASKKILNFICGAEDVYEYARGMNFSAKKLTVVETVLGESFEGLNGANPNNNASSILSAIYDEISDIYCFKLAKELYMGEYSELILCKTDKNGNKKINTAAFDFVIGQMENSGIDCTDIVAKAAVYIDLLSNFGYGGANDFYDTYLRKPYEYADAITRFVDTIYIVDSGEVIKTSADSDYIRGNSADNSIRSLGGDDMIFAGAGNDTVYAGNGNDVIYGEDGDDTINAGTGNDIINGGKGNDLLKGEEGSDTYIFNIGDGDDTIYDNDASGNVQNDRIIFGEGITAESIIMNRVGNNLIIEYGDGDRITVQGEFFNSNYGIEYIEFADGTVIDIDGIRAEASRYIGTDGDDVLNGYNTTEKYNVNEYFDGGDGNDRINAGIGDDTIFGGNGDDIIYAGTGNDIINGGKGNDQLRGDAGDDTYIFNIGDGDDTIYDYDASGNSQNDRIIFGEGITAESIIMNRVGNNLIIEYGDGDRITVQGEFFNSNYGIEYIEFADGTVIDIDGIRAEASRYIGTDGDDVLNGYNTTEKYNVNEYFDGGDGNDRINAGIGDDTIFGGNGDDIIYAGTGNDIINGGKGNDQLRGDAGDDTYIFNIGDGDDTIYDYDASGNSQNDRIIFGEGITAESIIMNRVGNNLIIEYGDGDRITVQNEFSESDSGIEYITLNDGREMYYTQAEQMIQAMASFEADSGMTWTEAVENGDERTKQILNEMWVKPA